MEEEVKEGPYFLLSLKVLESVYREEDIKEASRFASSLQFSFFQKRGSLIKLDNDVSTLKEKIQIALKEKGLETKEYQESVLPKGAKIFGMTAGLPVTLEGLVGANGTVFGLKSFGFSAPYKVLDEILGFTAENVYKQVKDFLAE